VIVFSCWEEHGGGSVGYLARYIYKKWNVRQALISDSHGYPMAWNMAKVAISLRDKNIPRREFVINYLDADKINRYQLEVEGSGQAMGENFNGVLCH